MAIWKRGNGNKGKLKELDGWIKVGRRISWPKGEELAHLNGARRKILGGHKSQGKQILLHLSLFVIVMWEIGRKIKVFSPFYFLPMKNELVYFMENNNKIDILVFIYSNFSIISSIPIISPLFIKAYSKELKNNSRKTLSIKKWS